MALTLPHRSHRALNACLAPLYSVESCAVTTVEGLGNVRAGLHPVQTRLANSHGSQCGFCTPGFIMSMYSLLRTSKARRVRLRPFPSFADAARRPRCFAFADATRRPRFDPRPRCAGEAQRGGD